MQISRRRFLVGSAAAGLGGVGLAVAGDAAWRGFTDAQAANTIDDVVSVHTTPYATLGGARVPNLLVADNAGRATTVSDGNFFVGSNTGAVGLLIADGAGQPAWWQGMPEGTNLQNFRVDTFAGGPALVYYTGTLDKKLGLGLGEWHVLNSAYQEIATVTAGNGYHADLHDVLLRDDGTAVVECYPTVEMDLSAHGGSSKASVLESVIQHVDVSTGKVISEWHSLDHIPVTETYQSLTDDEIDYMHVNTLGAVPGKPDSVLVSARHLSQVFELDLTTGKIGWRVGGKRASLSVTGRQSAPLRVAGKALPFSYQHDAQLDTEGRLTVFDNGNQRDPGFSRSVSYRIDTARGSVSEIVPDTLVHQPLFYASSQGNVQPLSGGRTLVGWGGMGYATVYAGREVAAEITGVPSYRTFLSEWHGRPVGAPTALVTDTGVLASWNGATDVAAWRVIDADDASHVLGMATKTGFETPIPLALAGGTRLVLHAIGQRGGVAGSSSVTTVD